MTQADSFKVLIVGSVLIGALFSLTTNKNSFTKLPYVASAVVLMSFCAFLFLRMIS